MRGVCVGCNFRPAWSLTQFYSVGFFADNNQCTKVCFMHMCDVSTVSWDLHALCDTPNSVLLPSVVLQVTYWVRRRPLKGDM